MNPALRRLGFDAGDRVVVIHADDLGMFQLTLPAFERLLEVGLVSSASAMVPCPWFPSVAEWCAHHTNADVGIHLTLTSEWSGYRWGPVSTRDPATGLIDHDGYFPADDRDASPPMDPAAVRREIAAQVQLARSQGLQPSHMDSHMFACMSREFIEDYLRLGVEERIPAVVFRRDRFDWPGREGLIAEWEEQGILIFDHLRSMRNQGRPSERVEYAKKVLDEMESGLSFFLFHPALDSPELRAAVPKWEYRVADYDAFSSHELREHVRRLGIHVVDVRTLGRQMPRARSADRENPVRGDLSVADRRPANP